jgi:hypothetical protein
VQSNAGVALATGGDSDVGTAAAHGHTYALQRKVEMHSGQQFYAALKTEAQYCSCQRRLEICATRVCIRKTTAQWTDPPGHGQQGRDRASVDPQQMVNFSLLIVIEAMPLPIFGGDGVAERLGAPSDGVLIEIVGDGLLDCS